MNEQLQAFARSNLKTNLAQLPEGNQKVFKLMYGRKLNLRGDPTRSLEDTYAMNIDDLVDEIEEEKLDWAMEQVRRTMEKDNSLQ